MHRQIKRNQTARLHPQVIALAGTCNLYCSSPQTTKCEGAAPSYTYLSQCESYKSVQKAALQTEQPNLQEHK